MKKTVSITLNNLAFTLEEEAYRKLKEYLGEIKDYFIRVDSNQAANEIIADIEASVAEKFSAKLKPGKEVINLRDVENLIKVMGTVTDIAAEDGNGEADKTRAEPRHDKQEPARLKKLFRNPDDVIIAGVCSGIATYFGVDSVIIRLIFTVSIFAGGAGIYIYLILWLILPMAKTTSEKLEMQGAQVTLKKLEDLARDKAEKLKKVDRGGIKRVLAAPFQFLNAIFKAFGVFFRKFGKAISIFFGILIIVGSVLTITAVGLAAAVSIFNINSLIYSQSIPIMEIVGSSWYYLGIISGFFVIFIPLIFILLLGASLASRKSAFNAASNSVLVGVWMIAIIVLGVVLIDVVPRVQGQVDEIIRTETITKSYDYDDFNSLRVGTNGELKLNKGEEYSIEITGPETAVSELQFSLEDNELKLVQPTRKSWCLVCPDLPLEIEITLPELESFIAFQRLYAEVKGFNDQSLRVNAGESARVKVYAQGGDLVHYIAGASGRVEIVGSPNTLNAVLEGAGRLVALELDTSEIKLNPYILSRVTLGGKTDKLKAELEGSARLSAFELEAREVDIKASVHSRAEVNVIEKLTAIAANHGRITYLGTPTVLDERKFEEGAIEPSGDIEIYKKYGPARLNIEVD